MSVVSTNAAGQAEVQADAGLVDAPPGVLDGQPMAELVDGQRQSARITSSPTVSSAEPPISYRT